MSKSNLDKKEEKLNKIIKQYRKACIGFSGGVDSTLLLYLTNKLIPVVAVTADGVMVPRKELQEAKDFSYELENVRHIIFPVDAFNIEEFRKNTPDRCYHCKRAIFSKINQIAQEEECDVIFEGANTDDLDDYRPGMKAIKELGIKSPFLEAGFTKSDIYDLSKKYQLPTINKMSAACLASRIPTNEVITYEKLRKIDQAEEYLKQFGFEILRLRLIDGEKGIIECSKKDIDIFNHNKEEFVNMLKDFNIELNLEPKIYIQGNMNEIE